MIDYHTFHQIHHLHKVEHLNQAQIAAELQLDEGTVSKWLQSEQYRPCQMPKRPSKLDPFKGAILRMLERHPYSSAQLLPRLKEQGYTGSYSILKAFVHQVRPAPTPAFLTLQFAPGECAQVDWRQAGAVSVGSTRRRLSFFVRVLCHSRMLYVEFTLGAAQKDTARELGARLASLKGIAWVGVGLFVFGLASLVWPPLKVIIGSVTTSAALMLRGVALMVLPNLVVGNELLILGVVGVAVGGWFLAHRHGQLRGIAAANTNGKASGSSQSGS